MTNYHIVLHRPMDFKVMAEEAAAMKRPRNAMEALSHQLQARIHAPQDAGASTWTHRLRSKLAGAPPAWSLAEHLATTLGSGDRVFCTSEAVGLPLAVACSKQVDRPKIAVFTHNLDRPRGRVALTFWRLAQHIDLFLACSKLQVDFLRTFLNLPESRVKFVWDHVDTQFFTPGPSQSKARPKIVSVGLEQRDYQTLAAATADLDVDVCISGFSVDAAVLKKTFPDQIPDNMSRQFYSWPDLVQLYRDADIVVVSVRENRYAAGVQSLMEAMACRRPVIVTSTAGLAAYIDDTAMTVVQPGNPQAMRAAIQRCLDHSDEADRQAQRGYEISQQRYGLDRYAEEIAGYLRSL